MNSDDNHPEIDFGYHIPAGREAFRVWEVAAIIRHTDQQVNDLIDLGKFGKVLNCGKGQTKSSRVISRKALLNFIQENSQ